MHAKRSPSGADRWAACPGSIAMEAGYPDESSEYADAGSAQHLVFADATMMARSAGFYLGAIVEVGTIGEAFDGAIWCRKNASDDLIPPPAGFVRRRSFVMGEPELELLGIAIENCREMLRGSIYAETEAEVPIYKLTGEAGATGHADVINILDEPGQGPQILRVLEVHDYKSGRNEVKPDCRQLKIYGLGAADLFAPIYGPFDKIRLVIHQPIVSDRPLVAEFLPKELASFAEEIRQAAALSIHAENTAAEWMGKSTEYLVPGRTDDETQCKYCAASGACPGQDAFITETIGLEFAALADKAGGALVLPGWDDPGGATLGLRLAAVPAIKSWAQAVEDRAYSTLMKGGPVAGHKLVQGKRGNRAWASEEEAEAEMKRMRLKQDVMYVQNLKTPTAMELALKELPSKWNKLSRLVTQAEGKPTLAPLSDRRPAIKPPGVATEEDFTELNKPFNPEDLL